MKVYRVVSEKKGYVEEWLLLMFTHYHFCCVDAAVSEGLETKSLAT